MSLIQKLEALTEPSREVADKVLLACGWRAPDKVRGKWEPPGCHGPDWRGHHVYDQPNPLDCFDDAIDLALPGYEWTAGNAHPEEGPWACVTSPNDPCPDFTGSGFNEATSLTIAWLKARGL